MNQVYSKEHSYLCDLSYAQFMNLLPLLIVSNQLNGMNYLTYLLIY